jgi:hypothetical protein
MYLSDREVLEIKTRIDKIDKAERAGAKRNYIANQTRIIRQIIKRAERREQNTLL